VVIVPVTPKEDTRDAVIASCEALAEMLRLEQRYAGDPIRVHVDKRDLGGGVKKWEWVKKGVPIRLEIGPRDLEGRKVCLQRRDQAPNEKEFVDREEFIRKAPQILAEIQQQQLDRLTVFRDENITGCSSLEDFNAHWEGDDPGWLLTPWAGSTEEEETLSKEHKITIRCLPNGQQDGEEAPCFLTGGATRTRALWGRAY